MDCETLRELLPYLVRGRNEVDGLEWSAAQEHLRACTLCAGRLAAENRFDRALKQALLAVTIPNELPERLVRRMGGIRRGIWWRRTAAAVVAASLIFGLATYLVLSFRGPTLSPLDLREFSGSLSQVRTGDQLQEWLDYSAPSALWLPAELRDRWDFNCLDHHYVQYLDGHAVPTLAFRKEHHRAKVFLLRQDQFIPSSVAEGYDPTEPSRPWKLGGDGVNEYVAVAIRESGDWQVFLLAP